MTREELSTRVRTLKAQAFDQIKSNIKSVNHEGWNSLGEMAVAIIKSRAETIEREIQVWEKANPL
jgi:hypothetical protein